MSIVATISGESSNSYVTLAEANEYFAGRLRAEAWETAKDGDKEKALLTACRHIEACRIRIERDVIGGPLSPVVDTQALSFPRYRDVNANLTYIVPEPVKQAQCEEALALLAYGPTASRRSALQAAGVIAYSVDGLSETYGTARSNSPVVSAEARGLIAPFILRGGVLATSPWPQGELTPGSRT